MCSWMNIPLCAMLWLLSKPPEPEPIALGTFTVTAYCPCKSCSGKWGNQTSTGVTAQPNHTIAVDTNVIPYGTEIYIDGQAYIAEDCGGAIKGKRIDIYFETHEETKEFGNQEKEVFTLDTCETDDT
jgi:3D (Asp-Asp-Asp) domain-containing protein